MGDRRPGKGDAGGKAGIIPHAARGLVIEYMNVFCTIARRGRAG
jgi:hypothetical protein